MSKYSVDAYENKKFGFVPDYIRCAVLYKYGGFYLDTDVEVLKRFDDLLDQDFVTCFENEVYIETAVLGSEPNHPYMKKLMLFYEHHSFKKENGELDLTPSPIYWTYFLKNSYNFKLKAKTQVLKCENNKTIKVFTNDYFAPINYTTKQLKTTENTYAIHHFANSWSGAKQKKRDKILKNIYKVFGSASFTIGGRTYLRHYFRKLRKEDKKNNYSKNNI
jgi:mannosyltransferase OCH1-like enzyme